MKLPFTRLPETEAPPDESVHIRYRSTAPIPTTSDTIAVERPFPGTLVLILCTDTILSVGMYLLVTAGWGVILYLALQAVR
jgi:hypothetical protein